MRTIHFSILAILASTLIVGCGEKTTDTSKTAAASTAASKPAPAASVTVGKVYVAPVSKIASAPGIDPMKASSLPPMPMSARASGPAAAQVALVKKN